MVERGALGVKVALFLHSFDVETHSRSSAPVWRPSAAGLPRVATVCCKHLMGGDYLRGGCAGEGIGAQRSARSRFATRGRGRRDRKLATPTNCVSYRQDARCERRGARGERCGHERCEVRGAGTRGARCEVRAREVRGARCAICPIAAHPPRYAGVMRFRAPLLRGGGRKRIKTDCKLSVGRPASRTRPGLGWPHCWAFSPSIAWPMAPRRATPCPLPLRRAGGSR